MSSTFLSQSRASWMYSDPYAYQYSNFNVEDDTPISQARQTGAAGGTCELEGSTPTDTVRYELAAHPLTEATRDTGSPQTASEPSSPCGLSRSRLTNGRASLKYSSSREHPRSASIHTAPVPYPYAPRTCSPQPASSSLIRTFEDAPVPAQHYVPGPQPPWQPRQSPPVYADGLMPVDEYATTLKEPSSDFDAILRNIGPISKKRGSVGRTRASRYHDRYCTNFG
jgi:hypothetical protein